MSEDYGEEVLKVLFDTNFLLAPVELGVDVEEKLGQILGNYRIFIPVCVKRELERLRETGKKQEREIDLALKLANKHEEIRISEVADDPDDALIEYSPNKNVVVCTNDKELINRLREKDVPVIFVRQNKLLDKIGVIE